MVSRDPLAASPALHIITGLFRMSDSNAESPQRYLRTSEAARHLTLSPRTLEKHRIYGTGPEYSKIGGRVVYTEEDLNAWAKRGKKKSTSDPGVSAVLPAKRHAPVPYAGKERR
jgi:predicted DNA-binding transcriptional regulator AlpA